MSFVERLRYVSVPCQMKSVKKKIAIITQLGAPHLFFAMTSMYMSETDRMLSAAWYVPRLHTNTDIEKGDAMQIQPQPSALDHSAPIQVNKKRKFRMKFEMPSFEHMMFILMMLQVITNVALLAYFFLYSNQ